MSKALDQLSKILNQAESSGVTDAERETYMARAASLASKMGIDLAVARLHYEEQTKREEPEKRTIKVGEYGASWRVPKKTNDLKMLLLARITDVYDVEMTIGGNSINGYCYGLPTDLDIVEAMYAITVVDMVASCDRAVKRGDNTYTTRDWVEAPKQAEQMLAEIGSAEIRGDDDPYPEQNRTMLESGVVLKDVKQTIDHPKVFRANFYESYIYRVVARMWDERRKAIEERDRRMAEARGEDYVEERSETTLVLADKKKEVDEFYKKQNPHLYHDDGRPREDRPSWKAPNNDQYSSRAQTAGWNAADAANLSIDDKVGVGGMGKKEIG